MSIDRKQTPEQNKGIGPTARSLPISLLRARETIMTPIREMLSDSKISEQQWRVLRVVDEAGELEQSEIADQACLLLPSLTRILKTMQANGLVERTTDAADRRKTLVQITDAGRTLIQKNTDKNAAILASVKAQFGEKKLDRLLDLLEEFQGLKL